MRYCNPIYREEKSFFADHSKGMREEYDGTTEVPLRLALSRIRSRGRVREDRNK